MIRAHEQTMINEGRQGIDVINVRFAVFLAKTALAVIILLSKYLVICDSLFGRGNMLGLDVIAAFLLQTEVLILWITFFTIEFLAVYSLEDVAVNCGGRVGV